MEPRPQAGDRSLLSSTLYLKGPKNLLSSPAGWRLGATIPESQGRTLNIRASFQDCCPWCPSFFSPSPKCPPGYSQNPPGSISLVVWLESPWGRAYSPTRDLLTVRDGPRAGTPHTHTWFWVCLASPLPEPQQPCQKRGRLLRRAQCPGGALGLSPDPSPQAGHCGQGPCGAWGPRTAVSPGVSRVCTPRLEQEQVLPREHP